MELKYPCAFVDGSYVDKPTPQYSCGIVIMEDSEHIKTGNYSFLAVSGMRNIDGELIGAKTAIGYGITKEWKEITIYYDYSGIEKWATGEWKRNKKGTQDYYQFCQRAKKRIKINFEKVKGHSGNKYNDMADKLAKEALGIK